VTWMWYRPRGLAARLMAEPQRPAGGKSYRRPPGDGETVYTWAGVDPGGRRRSGFVTCTAAELTAFVEERFAARWQGLSVVTGDPPVRVAGIHGGQECPRTWWFGTAGGTDGR
jgi:hypothetical protein